MSGTVRRVLGFLYRNWLLPYGHQWAHLYTAPPADPPALAGPAPGHPERLCPETPLTRTERDLLRRLGAG